MPTGFAENNANDLNLFLMSDISLYDDIVAECASMVLREIYIYIYFCFKNNNFCRYTLNYVNYYMSYIKQLKLI